jgi:hypothetical protein
MSAPTLIEVQPPLTESLIREALEEELRRHPIELTNAVSAVAAPIEDSDMALVRRGWSKDFFPPDDHPGTFWADLRESEAGDLAKLVGEAVERVEQAAVAMLIDEFTRVALAFAERYPDVPRGHWRPRPS